MIYITIKEQTQNRQDLNFENLIRYGMDYVEEPSPIQKEYFKTRTYLTQVGDASYDRLLTNYPKESIERALEQLAQNHAHLIQEDMQQHYETFYIPKHSGGMRRIDAPKAQLMYALKQFKDLIDYRLHALPHNAAHAYTPQRSIVTAMQKHQNNESKWFLKLDVKDFFPSHNLEYILTTLKQIYPFSEILRYEESAHNLTQLLKLGLLSDGLPQGTPTSPTLTNILMVPIDYQIQTKLRGHQRQNFIYTRYADDILISCKYKWDWHETETLVKQIFREVNAPFQIKEEKTRFSSSAGRNWNLGIMLNKDNRLTIGHKQNQRFRAMVHNFLKDLTNGITWNRMEVQVMLGQISYYKSIDSIYVTEVLNRYSQKFNIRFEDAAKQIVNQP